MPAEVDVNGVDEATPKHLTLRFKNGKTTVLLLALGTDTFTSIKSDLLSALKSTGTTSLNGKDIPSDSAQVELAIPVNKHDISQGWVALAITEDDLEAVDGRAGMARRAKALNETPNSAGLRDGAMIAFRFLEKGHTVGPTDLEWEVKVASLDDPDVRQDLVVEDG